MAEAGAPRPVPGALHVLIPVTCPTDHVPVLGPAAELLDYEVPPIREL